MAISNSQSQIGFSQIETTYGTIPNTTGTATVANANAFRLISLVTKGDTGRVDRPSKTANLSRTPGILGKKNGSWSTSVELAGSGAAGTAPDIAPFLHGAFGAAGTVVAATSVTYNLADASPSLSIWNFRDPAAMEQLVALGSIVGSMRFDISQDRSVIEFSGMSRYVSPSDGFASLDAPAKGGLSAFPVRPSAPVYAGIMSLGLYGSATLNSAVYTTLRSLSINAEFGRSLIDNVLFNAAYPGLPQQVVRNVTVDFELTDEDVAALIALKLKARMKEVMNLVFVVGATAGNICTITLKNVQLTVADYDESQPSWGAKFSGVAHATNATSIDELVVAFT